ncbi:MAG: class I SAM-dependent methyltransferase [Hellea sp.]
MDNQDQSDYWNGQAGRRWVEFSDRLDAMLLPFANQILSSANVTPDDNVLDIGCGGGALSILASQTAKSVLGIDISKLLIALAKDRTKTLDTVNFTLSDASKIALETHRDLIVSRFGIMFFADPVAAFANLRRQVKDTGRMSFACWQSPMKNMWARAPLEAAMPFLNHPPTPPKPHAPGPFAFADANYVTEILTKAGWHNIGLTDWTGDIRLPGRDAAEVASFMMEMGPLSRIMKEQNLDMEPVHAALIERLSEKASADGSIDMQASIWIVSATAAPGET